jgi:hypothetical protein
LGGEVGANFTLFEKNNTKIKATLDGGYDKVNLESVHIDENKNEISTNNKYNEIPISIGIEYQRGNFIAFAKAGGDILNGFKEGVSGQVGISYKFSSDKKIITRDYIKKEVYFFKRLTSFFYNLYITSSQLYLQVFSEQQLL